MIDPSAHILSPATGQMQQSSLAGNDQLVFRAIMNALARPGTWHSVEAARPAPNGLNVAAAATLTALCDFETAVWLSPSLQKTSDVSSWLSFHTNAKCVDTPEQAAFAVIDLAADELVLSAFAQGTADYPDRSTTLICMVPETHEKGVNAEQKLRLNGPGIKDQTDFTIDGLPDDFAGQWAANRAQFPLGVDIIFCSDKAVAGLPRSTLILAEAV